MAMLNNQRVYMFFHAFPIDCFGCIDICIYILYGFRPAFGETHFFNKKWNERWFSADRWTPRIFPWINGEDEDPDMPNIYYFLWLPIILGMSSSQLTNSYFSEGLIETTNKRYYIYIFRTGIPGFRYKARWFLWRQSLSTDIAFWVFIGIRVLCGTVSGCCPQCDAQTLCDVSGSKFEKP